MKIKLSLKPNIKEISFFAIHVFSYMNISPHISTVLILFAVGLSIYEMHNNNFNLFFALLLLGNYHSNGPSIYTLNIIGISIIYPMLLYFALLNLKFLRVLNRKVMVIIAPLILLIPINLALGYYYKFTVIYFFLDTLRFLFFYFFILLFSKGIYNAEFLRQIKLYIVYYVPLFFLLTGLLSPEIQVSEIKSNYFDEFSSFYILSILPYIFLEPSQKNKIVLLLMAVIVFIIKAKFFYFSSFELLGFIISIFLILYFSGNLIVFFKKLILVTFFLGIAWGLIYKYGNNYTKFKINQSITVVNFLINGLDKNSLLIVPFSPRVRILEFFNSIHDMQKSHKLLPLIGKGFGSSFKMEALPPSKFGIVSLYDTGSYSEEEIKRGEYKGGHNTISFLPSKIGFIGLFLMIYIAFIGLKLCRRTSFKWILIPSIIYMLMNMGYGLKNFILIGCLIGFILWLFADFNGKTGSNG